MPIDVFFAYAREDEALRDQLAKHLATLERQGVIRGWHDRQIGAGEDWRSAIDERLNRAGVILLLVSVDFLASDYCYNVEMKQALELHAAGNARVMPILLRHCPWEGAPFAKLQVLPRDAKPVTSWADRDEAWNDVVRGIRRAVEEIARESDVPPSASSGSSKRAAASGSVTIDSGSLLLP